MFPRTCDGNGVQYLKEVEVQHFEQVLSGALLRWPFAPCIKSLLCIFEDIINAAGCIQLFIDQFGIAFIGKRQLIFQIVEAVIDRCGRQHQDFRLDACADHFIQKPQVAVFFFALFAGQLSAVSEIV